MLKNLKNYRALVGVLAAFTVASCDVKNPLEGVNLRLKLTDAAVDLNGPAVQIGATGQLSEQTFNVSVDDPVESLDALAAITMDPSSFAFTPGSAIIGDGVLSSSVANAASGVLQFYVKIAGLTTFGVEITVTNNVVTAVTPGKATPAQVAAQVRSMAQKAVALNPALATRFAGAENLTADQIVARVNQLLTTAGLPMTIGVVRVSGDVLGSIQIKNFKLDGTVTD